jgi:XTP/dITP diphosphohydrolase
MIKKLYFITSNKFKEEEVLRVFKDTGIELIIIDTTIQEVMHIDLEVIIKDKLLKAHSILGVPCVVEHGALHIDVLNRLPGGISKVIWDNVEDRICNFIQKDEIRSATAKSIVGYCDGRKMFFFTGETKGKIATESKGSRKFQWDPIFIPDGSDLTYSEMKLSEKEKFSQGTKAWKELIQFLKEN